MSSTQHECLGDVRRMVSHAPSHRDSLEGALVPGGFRELEQEANASDSALERSRLHGLHQHVGCRISWTEWECVAPPTVPNLSAHHPVSFFCCGGGLGAICVAGEVFANPPWARRAG